MENDVKNKHCIEIAKVINSISIPMSYGELGEFLKKQKCPYYNDVLKNYKLFFDIKNYGKRTNGKKTPNYILKEKPVYYKKFYVVFEDKPKDEIPFRKKVFNDILSKKYVCYQDLAKIYEENKIEDITEKINSELKGGAICFKSGYYFLNENVGKLIDKNYKEPVIFPTMSKKEKKALAKMHDTRLEGNKNVDEKGAPYIIEFSQERQLFHYNNGTNEENTNGWRTVCRDVTDTTMWTAFDIVKDIFGYKFSSVNQIVEKFSDFNNAILQWAMFNSQKFVTTDICVKFLKDKGFSGKLEKVEKTTFDL